MLICIYRRVIIIGESVDTRFESEDILTPSFQDYNGDFLYDTVVQPTFVSSNLFIKPKRFLTICSRNPVVCCHTEITGLDVAQLNKGK